MLNESQKVACGAAISQRLTLIQGPPGTGKTHTAVRILQSWSSQNVGTILAVADSNVAVDNLLEGLLGLGVSAVRLGQPVKVRESLREATVDAQMESHPLRRDLEEHLELNEKYVPNKLLLGSFESSEMGLLQEKYVQGRTMIYICEDKVCQLPTTNIMQAKKLMK